MDAPQKPLTPAVYHTLLALAQGPLHGYAISADVEETTAGQVKMGPGTLYGTLQRLETAGMVKRAESTESDSIHEDRRRYHELTPRGRTALAAEAERLVGAVRLARERSVLGGADVG